MRFSYFDSETVTGETVARTSKKLREYETSIQETVSTLNQKKPEYSLAHAGSPELEKAISSIPKNFSKIKHLILVGVGGSSLGLEAIHQVLGEQKVKLSVLDTVSAHKIEAILSQIASVKDVSKIAVCVVSKSGGTTETMVNANVLLDALAQRYKETIYTQTLFVGDPDTDFMKAGKRLGVTLVPMPVIVGGRYSVATEVGLVPLALLGHDVDAFLNGFTDAGTDEFAEIAKDSAARIFQYSQKGYTHYNFFAFETRLEKLGAWYRQLFAESLGKAFDKDKQPVKKGMLPTISTPVELHSVGQLYLSGFPGVYTDFVTFDDDSVDFKIPKKGISKDYGRFSVQEVTTALYGGVISAYQEKQLPYRTTIFDDNLAYSLGSFMSLRMREVMYVANLMNLNAFDQPNVELYKKKTKNILGL